MADKEQTILVVDDVEDITEALMQILQYEGYNVITASNGITALTAINGQNIDLVITDVLMPEMDGMELVTKINESNPGIKCILMSAGGRKVEDDYDYLEVVKKLTGVGEMLRKPFEPDELISLVGSMLSE